MKILLTIGAGSFIGGILRYLTSQFVQSKFLSAFPFGTLAVNIAGCFLIGIVFGLSDKGNLNQEMRLFLATGILGGFTTFSAFSSETIGMMNDGQILYAIAYVASSVILGLLSTFFAVSITKLF
jgi:fluoride exporter